MGYSEFLSQLDKVKKKILYAQIVTLTNDELPIERIEGRITQGSINIDGASAVRRTCSLSLVSEQYNYETYSWEIGIKFKLSVGVENKIDPAYPAIIWFPQGTYVVTSFSTSETVNNFSLSLQGKDKMCLLNGEIGGSLESSVDFGTIEEEDSKGNWVIRKIPIKDIIRNAVHVYGGEPYHNIIINDLDTYGLELLEYRYDVPMYLYRAQDEHIYTNALIENDKTKLYDINKNPIKLKDLTSSQLESLTETLDDVVDTIEPVYSDSQGSKGWYFAKVEYGQTAGYRVTDLVYAGDLIGNIGESLVSVLDKIKTMLVEFEYFYDLYGRFVFQKKRSYLSTMWQPQTDSETFADPGVRNYSFEDVEQIISLNSSLNLANVKNDFSVWGSRKGISGAEIPIHLRYAIDSIPKKYTQVTVTEEEIADYNEKYQVSLKPQLTPKTFIGADYYLENGNEVYCDWREVIYQMALDYFKYNHLDDFEIKVRISNEKDYPAGRTGYEQYYTDLQGFWRLLYYPDIANRVIEKQSKVNELTEVVGLLQTNLYGSVDENGIKNLGIIDDINYLTTIMATSSDENIIADIERISLKWDVDKDNCINELNAKYYQWSLELPMQQAELAVAERELKQLELQKNNYYSEGENIHWYKDIYENPSNLNFWFDFLDGDGELEQFNVKAIGNRAKSINDSAINSIYFRETPEIIFQEKGEALPAVGAYKSIQVPEIDKMFSISAQGKSAKDKLEELLYQHAYRNESITITATPIYYLQPNVRVFVPNKDKSLEGDYIISKITYSLAYNGTMSITATKAAKDILW